MKKTISLLLTFVVIFSLLCSCKTPEEKKAEAFAKAVEKNDVVAMNEYVEKYFEWSDLLSEDAKFRNSNVMASRISLTFDEWLDYFESDSGIVVELTVMPGFSQIYIWGDEKYDYIGEPVFVQKAQIKKIYKDYSESPTLEENSIIPISTYFAGINKNGECVIQDTGHTDIDVLNEGHTYIAMLNLDSNNIYSGVIYPVNFEKEYEFLRPYYFKPLHLSCHFMRENDSFDFAHDMFEFYGINYTVPESVYEFPVIVKPKENETEKEKAFREAVAKYDHNAMNEYVCNYFEWTDLFSEDAKLKSYDTNSLYDIIDFEEYNNTVSKKEGGIYAEITILPGFDQVSDDSGNPFVTQKAQIKKIYNDYSEAQNLKKDDVITLSTYFVGIDENGRYVMPKVDYYLSAQILLENHTYIVALFSEPEQIYSAKISFPVNYEQEIAFYGQYANIKLVRRYLRSYTYNSNSLEFARDMFKFCKVSKKYVVPSSPDWDE